MAITAKGQPNGLATLDEDGRIPADQATQGVAVTDVAALTSTAASGGDSPTEAEHNALRADVVAIRTTLLALQDSLRDAGLIASA